jgi:membrane-associated PAP2 superfamily phosphatase
MNDDQPTLTWSGRDDRTLWPAVLILVGVIAVFETTNLDLVLQDGFFDFTASRWWMDASDPLWRALCYTGPKAAIIGLALALLALAAGPARWRTQLRMARRDLIVALLTLASVPALVGLGKSSTNVFCPSELRRYGGDVRYVKLGERFPPDDTPARRGRGFPAGHASGGFALVGLMWLRRTRAWRRGILLLAMGAGWWMGGYQMLRGAHFLSHTVTTMLMAWIIVLTWRRVLTPAGAATVTAAPAASHLNGGNARSRG